MKEEDLKSLGKLAFPVAPLRLAKDGEGNVKVFDQSRDKWVMLTPEEWVRQNFVHWMITSKGYPRSRTANEVEIKLNHTKKRCDTVVFGMDFKPLVIVEYKAKDVEISQDTFDQIVRYNMILRARYLIVTNGIHTYCCAIDYEHDTYHFIPTIPTYAEAEMISGEN